MTAAFEGFVDHVILVEKDPDVAAVWKCVCSKSYNELSKRILDFEVTESNVKQVLSADSGTIEDSAFRTIIKNRMFHGGILAPGASLMKSGENGKGLKSRWYAKTLADRVDAIGSIRERFSIIEGDGINVLDAHKDAGDAVFFIDPPYTAAGKKAGSRLYRHSELNHHELFEKVASLAGEFLMTYDNAEGVVALARGQSFDFESIAMKNTHHAEMSELLIGRDLTWSRIAETMQQQLSFEFDAGT